MAVFQKKSKYISPLLGIVLSCFIPQYALAIPPSGTISCNSVFNTYFYFSGKNYVYDADMTASVFPVAKNAALRLHCNKADDPEQWCGDRSNNYPLTITETNDEYIYDIGPGEFKFHLSKNGSNVTRAFGYTEEIGNWEEFPVDGSTKTIHRDTVTSKCRFELQ